MTQNLPDAILDENFILLGDTSAIIAGWWFRVLQIKNAQTQCMFSRYAIMIYKNHRQLYVSTMSHDVT